MTYALYLITLGFFVLSFHKDKKKTRTALKKAWKAFENILPQFLGVLVLTGIVIAALDAETISEIIGRDSGWLGTVGAACIGAITLIPGFVAFPMAALLLQNGAGSMQIAAFVSTLMMVGVVTFPVEKAYFGTKIAVIRNVIAFFFSFFVAAVIAWAVPL